MTAQKELKARIRRDHAAMSAAGARFGADSPERQEAARRFHQAHQALRSYMREKRKAVR